MLVFGAVPGLTQFIYLVHGGVCSVCGILFPWVGGLFLQQQRDRTCYKRI